MHDVKLKKAPKGAKKFHSQPASAELRRSSASSTSRGRYKIVCTLHEEMKMTITVRR